jgi:signal recognition particle subunit SRP54
MYVLEEFEVHGFVSGMLQFGDAASLARRIEQIDKDKQKETTDIIFNGHFTFRELYSQYQTVLEMGDHGSLVDSMGMAKHIRKGASSERMEDDVKWMLIVMDSMTDRELDSPSCWATRAEAPNRRRVRASDVFCAVRDRR